MATTQNAGPRQDAPPTNTLTLNAVLPRLSRLRCDACRGRIMLHPPTFELGFLYCLDCGRQYNAVVERLTQPLTPAEDAAARRRGRRPGLKADERSPRYPCRDGCSRLILWRDRRCRACSRVAGVCWQRLLEALSDGSDHYTDNLCETLGISRSTLAGHARTARDYGYAIRTGRINRRGVYTLEREAS